MREIRISMYNYKENKDNTILIKGDESRKYIESGVGWKNRTKSGNMYISAKVNVNGKEYNIKIFKNNYYKKGGKSPFFTIPSLDDSKENIGALWDKDFFYQGNVKLDGYEYSMILASTKVFSEKAPSYKLYVETEVEEDEEYQGGKQTVSEEYDDSDLPF